jgi:hypothetical protein
VGLETLSQQLVSVVMRDELRQYFRPHHTKKETLPLVQQRQLFRERLLVLQEQMVAIS